MQQTFRTAVAEFAPVEVVGVNDVSADLDISMASKKSDESMDISYGRYGSIADVADILLNQLNQPNQPDRPVEQQLRHQNAFSEIRRTFLNGLVHCFLSMFSIILKNEN